MLLIAPFLHPHERGEKPFSSLVGRHHLPRERVAAIRRERRHDLQL